MSQTGYEINALFSEAQTRWLKPAEVLYILQNHEKCELNQEPPIKPTSGSVFLFNRRILRFFRKDGHKWRKQKNGITVAEAHERLKVGNEEALNCYYAHGEENPNFQRRVYWIMDPDYEHIVLVHYREVTDSRKEQLVEPVHAGGSVYQYGGRENEQWLILFTSLVIEGLSAIFEQLNYAMLGMLMAIFGFLICAVEIVYGARSEQVRVEWRGMLPLLYSHYPTYKPFGSSDQYFGLVAAIWQCFHASLGYVYARKNAENPIKMTITMFLFCMCLVVSKVVNKYSGKNLRRETTPEASP